MIHLKRDLRQCLVDHQRLMDPLFLLCGKAVCPLLHMDLAVFFADIFRDLRQFFAADCHHFDQQGRRVDAILSVNVSLHGQTSGRLAADDRIGLLHLCGNVLKADRHLITLLSEAFCHLVQHMRGRKISHHRTAPAAVF